MSDSEVYIVGMGECVWGGSQKGLSICGWFICVQLSETCLLMLQIMHYNVSYTEIVNGKLYNESDFFDDVHKKVFESNGTD